MKRSAFSMLVLLLLSLLLITCGRKEPKAKPIVYNAKVTAFTSGVVSNQAVIRIELSEPITTAEPGKTAPSNLLSINPTIDGELVWEDNQTLILQPDEKLKSGQEYIASLDLPALYPNEEKKFDFSFEVIQQFFRYEPGTLRPQDVNDLTKNSFSGSFMFADYADPEQVEKILEVEQKGKVLKVTWVHNSELNKHEFVANDIVRGESSGSITVKWNGKHVGVDNKGSESTDIPSLKDFSVMGVKTIKQPSQQIIVTFSDPLMRNQMLDGLITIGKRGGLKFTIDANNIVVFPKSRVHGNVELKIHPGIKNTLGYEFDTKASYTIHFETFKPEVQLIGKGTILPNSQGLIFPFKTVSLRAIDVSIIKIFENNIASFLQVNHLNGSEQLRRAGRLVKKKTILLDTDKSLDLSNWNTFSLDLATLINPDPGAIYRVELNIQRKYSLYPCEDGETFTDETIEDVGITDKDEAYWDSPHAYYYSNWDSYENDYNYDWRERDNPCNHMYYRNKKVSRNILASNLGLIVKGGSNKQLLVAVSDLTTTNPVSDVDIEILNYQNQLVGNGKSNEEGLSSIDVRHKPFLLVAKKGSQRGYLRLDAGSALSVSRFDVAGQTIRKGLKGFIYGERGVWRPGDTLFVSFMLEDKTKSLPENHPVIFELINPHGQIHSRQVTNVNESGLYAFKVNTEASAPTGSWIAKVQVGGASFQKVMRIETIKPNRLKIEFDFKDEVIKKGQDVSATLKSKWLHGAIARNLKANVNVTLNQTSTMFKGYSDFEFDDPSHRFDPEELTIFEGKLNEEGIANVSATIETSDMAPGMLKASFLTRVYEESGDFSVDRFTMPYAPYETFVGLRAPKGDRRGMLLTDEDHTIDVVTVDGDGKPITTSGLVYRIYKVNWRWWWESSEDDLARYMGSSSRNLVASGNLNCTNGKGQFDFKIKYPDWGRYLIWVSDKKGGHSVGKTVYVDWPGWALKPTDNPRDAAMLTFSADKEQYNVGEEVTLTFPSPGKGRALVSVESGTRVLKTWWVNTSKGVTNTTFTASADMAPNIYANITLIQPHQHSDNDLPIRLYGIIPIMVEDPQTILSPILLMPDELEPEKEVTLKISEAGKNKMSYTIAVVDDGLLDLTRFKTPNPWQSFYAREALGVKTWDLYDYVMGAYGGKIERAFSLGGDDEMEGKKGGKKANRFKPMVKFFGPFTLDGGKTAEHTFKVPRYIGSVRTMVIASNNGAYGKTEKTTPVRKPVMALATLPRVLGPGEQVKLPVTVFAMKDDIKLVNVKIEVEGPITIEGNSSSKVAFDAAGDKVVNFDLKVKEAIGVGKVKIRAYSGKNEARDEIEIEIRNPNPPVSTTVHSVVNPNETVDLDYELPGIIGTNSAVVEISSIPPIDFGRRLKYLIKYPHGCIEQTTSAAFPQLFLGDVIDLREEVTKRTEKNIREAIYRLKQFILTDGSFSYWPGNSGASDWGTSYGGHFLLEAEAKGYSLPIGWKKNWIRYQKQASRRWTNKGNGKSHASHDMLSQAYRLYTLALSGNADMSAMNRLRNVPKLTAYAKWRLAAAYGLAGQNNIALKLIESLPQTEETPRNYYDFTFGSNARNRAMIIETLVLLGKNDLAMPMIIELSKTMSSETWMSTQTTAYGLLAISKFINANPLKDKGIQFAWAHNGKQIGSYTTDKAVYQDSLKLLKNKEGKVSITNYTGSVIYAQLAMQGIPAVGEETASSSNLKLGVEYKSMSGESIDAGKLEQGTDFMAVVTVTHTGILSHYRNLALSQIFPSGWEIRNTRMEDIKSAYEMSVPDYRDIRDDRVYSYFDIRMGKSMKFVVLLNATYKGIYYLPAVSCEAQYDNAINARVPGKWVVVE